MTGIERVGQHVGDYRLVRQLGRGSFGEVYLSEDRHTHSPVAIKLLQAKLAGRDEWREFLNEARVFRLNHPHIVRLLDFGITDDEFPFLVMEYAPNGTLRTRHPKGTRVPLSTVVGYVETIASALHYAHEQRLIHRDVKPENILLGPDDVLLLSDFGIVTAAHNSHSLDATRVVGTPSYMAPEQLNGRPRPASDQYALGIMAYEWLTGVRPFNGTYLELISQHVATPPTPLRAHLPDLPVEVEQVVLTALAKDPKARFATVRDFAQAMRLACTTDPSLHVSVPEMPGTLWSPTPSIPEAPVVVTPYAESSRLTEPMLLSPRSSSTWLLPVEASAHHEARFSADMPSLTPIQSFPAAPSSTAPPIRQQRVVSGKKVLVLTFVLLLLLGSSSIALITINSNTIHMQATATAQGLTATVQGSTAMAQKLAATAQGLTATAQGLVATSQASLTVTAVAHMTATVQARATVAASMNLDANCYLAFYNTTDSLECAPNTGYNGISISVNNVSAMFVNRCARTWWVHEYTGGTLSVLYFTNYNAVPKTIDVSWPYLTQVDVTSTNCTL